MAGMLITSHRGCHRPFDERLLAIRTRVTYDEWRMLTRARGMGDPGEPGLDPSEALVDQRRLGRFWLGATAWCRLTVESTDRS